MPLGTGNDLSGVLGWGRKAPGNSKCPCAGAGTHLRNLQSWFDRALRATTPVMNFDVWGFMPPPDQDSIDVKICELESVVRNGCCGKRHLVFKKADAVVPCLCLLYATYGFA